MRLASVFTLIALASPALAQEADGVRLRWVRVEGGESCIEDAALADEVRRRLGRDPFVGETRQTIEGTVGREGNRWVARLYNRDAAGVELGTRELSTESESCHVLDSPVALAIALAIDPEAALSAPEEEEVEPTTPTPEVRVIEEPARRLDPPREVEPPAEPAQSTNTVGPGVAIALEGAVDLVPGFAGGISITTDAAIVDPLRWRLGVLFVPESRTGGASAEFGFGLTAVTIDGCAVAFTLEPLSGAACVGVAVGALHSVVHAPIPTRPGDYIWAAARAAFELSVTIERRVWIALALNGSVPFVRWAFRVEGRENPEFQQPYVIPGGTLSAGVRFW